MLKDITQKLTISIDGEIHRVRNDFKKKDQ